MLIIALDDELSNSEKKVIEHLRNHNLSEKEVDYFLKNATDFKPNSDNKYRIKNGSRRTRVGVISDTHFGSSYFSQDNYDYACTILNKKSIDMVVHSGDIIEGMSNREGHMYELDVMGVSNQKDFAIQMLNEIDKPFYFVLGNHDLWSMKKANQGYHLGPEFEENLPEGSQYLGDERATLTIDDKVDINIAHAGNNAYALSYPLQKLINSIEPKNMPDVITQGHIHKSGYFMYQGVHALMTGALQEQTPFMRSKGAPSHTGFWVLDISYDKEGIKRFKPEYYTLG